MLALEPTERLSAKRLLKHSFFGGLKRNKSRKPKVDRILNDCTDTASDEWKTYGELTKLETPSSGHRTNHLMETVKVTKRKTVSVVSREDTIELAVDRDAALELLIVSRHYNVYIHLLIGCPCSTFMFLVLEE